VSIGRAYDNGETLTFLTGVKLASKNVIVQNSDITIDFTADTVNPTYTHDAGIYICADRSVAPPENITITGNTVRSKGRGTSAAQGLAVGSYGPSISITNNSLKSETGGTETINAPAAGLFMSIMPNRVNATDTPNITGNTLDGKNIDFYVNIYPTGDYKGIPALFDAKFGTAASKWAVTNVSNSFYGKLYATLIGQAKPTGYAGSFFMGFPYTDPEQWGYRFAYEAWEKNAGRVVAVDYWGPTIQSGASIYDAQGKRIDHSGAEATYGTTGGYRGRIVLATGGIEAFQWNPTTAVDTDTYSTVPQQE
jgi:hypothetical protein